MKSLDQIFLDEKASLFLSAFETTTQPMAISDDATSEFIYANQAFLDLLGYESNEVIGKTHSNLNVVNRKADIDRISKELKDKGYIHEYPILLNTRFNEIKYGMLSVNIFEIKGKKLRFTVLEDKTDLYLTQSENQKIEQMRKEDNERYRALVESTRDLIWIVDPVNYGILMYNEPFQKYMEAKGNSIALGMTPAEMLRPENVDLWKSLFKRAVEEGRFSMDYFSEGGLYLYLTISPLRVAKQLIGISVFAEDVTEQTKYKMALEESNKKLSKMFDQSIQAISIMGELKDPYTAGRQKRVQELAVAIATEMGLDKERINNLSLGALVHDIGKIYVPEEVLSKTGGLTEDELKVMRDHPNKAYKIIKNIDLPEVIPTMILQHHERLDGSGYPKGLRGDDICLEARIIAVADLVEAMNFNRSYRLAPGMDLALAEILKYRGTKFDEKIVDTCIGLFKEKNFNFSS